MIAKLMRCVPAVFLLFGSVALMLIAFNEQEIHSLISSVQIICSEKGKKIKTFTWMQPNEMRNRWNVSVRVCLCVCLSYFFLVFYFNGLYIVDVIEDFCARDSCVYVFSKRGVRRQTQTVLRHISWLQESCIVKSKSYRFVFYWVIANSDVSQQQKQQHF